MNHVCGFKKKRTFFTCLPFAILTPLVLSCAGSMSIEFFSNLNTKDKFALSAVAGDTMVTLGWNTVSGASSYNLYWNTTGNPTTADNGLFDVQPGYIHYNLTNGSTYYYVVTAVIAGVEGTPSSASSAKPQSGPISGPVCTNGNIYAFATDGTVTYFGGDFTTVSKCTGAAVPIDTRTGQLAVSYSNLAQVAGTVYASTPDGTGGWYIGGIFSSVGGVTRNNLAHILSDGSLDAGWNPGATNPAFGQSGAVLALAVMGSTIYVGGEFTSLGGQVRNYLGAVDTAGSATSWNPNPNNWVEALTVSGTTLYAAGGFTTIAGQGRKDLAAFDASGTLSAWNPSSNGVVYAVAVYGSTIYVGGSFTSMGGQGRNYLAAIDLSGSVTAWNPGANNSVFALAVSTSTVYAGGSFTQMGGFTRTSLAAIDTTGNVTSWNPSVTGQVNALAVSGGNIIVGSQAGPYARTFDASGGRAMGWNPAANGVVHALSVDGFTVLVGGELSAIAEQARQGLAAIDSSGAVTAWNPGAVPSLGYPAVLALAVSGSTVYVGGGLDSLGGQTRAFLGAVDSNGNVTTWNPGADAPVWALAVNGSTIYVGGEFGTLSGQSRNLLGALDSSGSATSWDAGICAGCGTRVRALVPSVSSIFAAGNFFQIGGQSRHYIAEIDYSGAVTAWNPNVAGTNVQSIALSGGSVYLGGDFTFVGGTVRNYLAKVDASTGALSAWNPGSSIQTNGWVQAISVVGSNVYLGGYFTSIAGQNRSYLASVDGSSGSATTWVPVASGAVYSLLVSGTSLFVGGSGPTPRSPEVFDLNTGNLLW